jgi:ATP-dependent helicase HrpB
MNPYPIDPILPELKEAIINNPSVVLHAPPGAGKTTRVPIALLELIPPEQGRIIMLEPRRIAAVSAARWMARLLDEPAGKTVGYSIRFQSKVSQETRIEVVTEGILTRRIQFDPELRGVSMIIFDEFHERSLHADLALALSLDIRLNLRPDLKLLVMSATMDTGPIASLLGSAPVISSSGKAFPVEERYIEEKRGKPLYEKTTDAVKTALKECAGDILVFLPGAGEIRAASEALLPLVKLKGKGLSLHQLYGDLPFEEQERALLPCENRKIVLSTNIAETSLTIEGVRVVIDCGLTRRLRYDPSTGMNRLITVPVSKASAEQRKGRAGRLGPGVCYRLYSRYSFESSKPFTPPEILESDLSSLVLELAAWGVGDPAELSWLDAPPASSVESARQLLADLGALDTGGSVTSTGKAMVRLPLHPRLARLLLRASELGCTGLSSDLAALLSERDIFRRSAPAGLIGRMVHEGDPDIAHRIDLLNAWRDGKELPGWVDIGALKTVQRSADQLRRLLPKTGQASVWEKSDADIVSRLILCAFPDRIAGLRVEGEGRFILVSGRGVRLPFMCGLSKSPYIVAVNADAGDKTEGIVHIASPLTETLIREECAGRIRNNRRVEWDKREGGLTAVIEELLGSVVLSERPFNPSDDEAAPLLCEAVRTSQARLNFSKEARQLQGRVALMKRVFTEEAWPDLSVEHLTATPEKWLQPWLGKTRSSRDITALDLFPALRGLLTWQQSRLLDERAPSSIFVPSGRRIALDYASGEIPVLAVKLQEMFGLADTPEIAGGRVKVLLHLLSPGRRPVQITQDLKGFWDNSYRLVKRELKGRYPKHPWPDDPWNAVPTRRVKPKGM